MAKKKKGKLPKEVLGVKVPKELRKAGEKLIEQVQGPAGRQAIAGALTAVAGAAMTAAVARAAKDSHHGDAAADPAREKTTEPTGRRDEAVEKLVSSIVTLFGNRLPS
ncbi:hypothetical protein QP166_08875 [Sphingomonas sp. LR60]|uniref:hypothetical protein n=1 Tax=Sphingomonas sp. LR60 TaxID=3050233 RepID=UPI002FE0BDE8